MNLVLLDPDEMDAGGVAVVVGRRAEHIARVVRPAVGDRLRVGVVRGRSGRGEVLEVAPSRVSLRVVLERPAPEPPAIDLLLAVPRTKALARAVQAAASLGVGRIDLVNAWRVDRSYLDSPRLAPDALAREARLGCEQGATTWVPEVAVHRLLMPLLDRAAPTWEGRRRLLAHPRAERHLEAALAPGDLAPALVAIGPEGGWIEREVASFEERGFVAVSVGSPVLRVEAAIPAVLAQLALLRRLPPAR
jgi:16S rRNA (uracil1498-N3)-methyltransferase